MRRALLLFAFLLAPPLARAKADDPRAVTQDRMDRLAREISSFRDRGGRLPTSGDGVDALAGDPALMADGWGNPILYVRVAGGYALVSFGSDGAPGGDGDAADIVRFER